MYEIIKQPAGSGMSFFYNQRQFSIATRVNPLVAAIKDVSKQEKR